jgi:positive regulator of sigma E activity
MTDSGYVVKIKENLVYIEVESAGGCAGCQMNKKCMMSTDLKKCTIIAEKNGFDLKNGDKVVYVFHESYFLAISVSLYLIPAILLIICASLGYFSAKYLSFDGDIGAITGFMAGILLSVSALKLSGKKRRKNPYVIELIS